MADFSSPAAREKAFEAARKAFEEQQWSAASSAFQTLYQDQQTPELNCYLVMSLFYDQQYLAAEQIAAEQDQIYLTDETLFTLRLDVALQNQQFIFAREFCELPDARNWREAGLEKIRQGEEEAEQSLAATQKTIAKQFYHLGDVSFSEQRQRLERAKQLPLVTFMKGVQYLLVDPFLHPLIRATLLEELLRLKADTSVQLHWLDDQTYTVATKDLKPVGASQAARAIQSYLQLELGQNDPMLAVNLQQTVTLQLMMLYPFIDKVITQPVLWVQAVGGITPSEADSEKLKDVLTWQQRLNRYLAELFGPLSGENTEKPKNE
ncbi:hypothetical protein [Levilactobacillus tongjiangensis]|uniref:TPR repeat-containing protein n=1 Tax=Levilactobacillus tongjiangensis TaxID=2486023 RepID=A0ABW1SNT7_9LACO|nr:hypothetical protein [Levilactobacillus tongjiangensis]